MKVLTLESLNSMTLDQRWALIDGNAKPVRPLDMKKCNPNWIGPLYCNTPMPHYDTMDGTSIKLNVDNVFNGTFEDVGDTDNVTMSWTGYTCQLYDGELKMAPIAADGCSIRGTCNGIAFEFSGTRLMFGCWPGFLLLYSSFS